MKWAFYFFVRDGKEVIEGTWRITTNKFWMDYFILSNMKKSDSLLCYGAKVNLNKYCYGAKCDGRSPTHKLIDTYTHMRVLIHTLFRVNVYLKIAFDWKLHGVVVVVVCGLFFLSSLSGYSSDWLYYYTE